MWKPWGISVRRTLKNYSIHVSGGIRFEGRTWLWFWMLPHGYLCVSCQLLLTPGEPWPVVSGQLPEARDSFLFLRDIFPSFLIYIPHGYILLTLGFFTVRFHKFQIIFWNDVFQNIKNSFYIKVNPMITKFPDVISLCPWVLFFLTEENKI